MDRHATIGQGFCGLGLFARIMNDHRLNGIPCLLETPVDDWRDYATELALLRSLYAHKGDGRMEASS